MRIKLMAPLVFAALASQLHAEGSLEFTNTQDKASYAIGLSIGNNLHGQSLAVNPDALAAGLKDALTGAKPRLADQERHEALTTWQKEQMDKLMAERKE